MARKFIEFLEAAALIILTGVIVIGVMKYIDTKEEVKEEDPIVEVEPGTDEEQGADEIISLTIIDNSDVYENKTIQYVKGMTWGEFINSEYNTDGLEFSEDYIIADGFTLYVLIEDEETMINPSDLIDNNLNYIFLG